MLGVESGAPGLLLLLAMRGVGLEDGE